MSLVTIPLNVLPESCPLTILPEISARSTLSFQTGRERNVSTLTVCETSLFYDLVARFARYTLALKCKVELLSPPYGTYWYEHCCETNNTCACTFAEQVEVKKAESNVNKFLVNKF